MSPCLRLLFSVHLLFIICDCGDGGDSFKDDLVHREKREFPLLFHRNSSVVNFICGFGVPVRDLQLESVVTGIVFKSQHYLPASFQDLVKHSTTSINGRSKDDLVNENNDAVYALLQHQQHQITLSKYRWTVYRGMELLAERIGVSGGRSCVLRSICEAAETPFRYESGLLGELMHILLTPSSSVDELSGHADNVYLTAEQLGRNGTDCAKVFQECSSSILDKFSHIFEIF